MIPHALAALTRWSVRRPRLVVTLAVLAALLGLAHAAARLEIRTSNLDLIDPDLPEVRAFTDFAERFGSPNVLVVVLEGEEPEALGRAVDQIEPVLRELPGVRTVIGSLPLDEDTLEFLGLDAHLVSDDGGMAFLFVQPDDPHSRAETLAPFVNGVREALSGAEFVSEGVSVGLTGMPVYALDDKNIISRDISLLSLVGGVLILLLFIVGFHSAWRPFLAVATLLLTLAMVLGLVAAYPGHLTLLSAFFASILLGLGIDFAIHVLGHCEEGISHGLSEAEAAVRAVDQLGRGLSTGALTSALVFFAMTLSGFQGFAELGIIAGVGILACLLAMVSLLPALLVLIRPQGSTIRRAEDQRIGQLLHRLQHPALACTLGLIALAAFFVPAPPFDTDYLNLQPEDSETVRLERAMVDHSDLSPNFAVFVRDSKEEALALSESLLELEIVGEVSSIADLELLMDPDQSSTPIPGRASLESADGQFAIYAYPAGDTWEPTRQAEFLAEMRALDPNVTGMPFLGSFMVERSQRAMRVTAMLGALILFACVWLDFRRLLPTLAALLPTLLAFASMHALMRAVGISYNPLNVMALPVVLGISVDDGVHVVHRFLNERGNLKRTLAGTGRSIVLTTATTLAALGTLAFTSHRGLASFALAPCLGVGSALVMSVLVLPQLLVALAPRLLRDPPTEA